MQKDDMLQDKFLQMLCAKEIAVSIFLVNGIKLQGKIEVFDDNVILLKNSTTQMVFKHAVSTIVPTVAVTLA